MSLHFALFVKARVEELRVEEELLLFLLLLD